jgi:Ca2+-transporting ATPase
VILYTFERCLGLFIISNRRLDNKFNVFEGISRNWFFIGINIITIGGQVIIISVGGSALSTIRLDGTQWALSIAIGAISLPVAVLIRLIPNDFLLELISNTHSRKQIPRDERFEWNEALENVREQLTLLKNIRGGRLKTLKFTLQAHREPLLSSNPNSIPGTPNTRANGDKWTRSRANSALGPAAVMAGVIAGSIAGWSPVARRKGDDDSNGISSSRPRAT